MVEIHEDPLPPAPGPDPEPEGSREPEGPPETAEARGTGDTAASLSEDSPSVDERRETTGGVLGIGFGLLVAFLFLMSLLFPSGGGLDAAERVEELFGPEPLPFGLEVEHAAVLPTGDKVLQLQGGGGEASRGPDQVVLIQYRSMKGLSALFQSEREELGERLASWEKDPSFSWQTILERDEIRWGPWRSKFARVRHFEEGGSWTETARVDLSQADRPLALMAKWGEKEEMNKDELIELLNRIEMLESGDDS